MVIGARTRNKILAILAGGLVVGLGSAVTLASWSDNEWAFGGDGAGGPGVGTSTFAVEQLASDDWTWGTGSFASYATNPGDAMTFSPNALAMTPGDTAYAGVVLRETAASTVGGSITAVAAAVPAAGVTVTDAGSALWDNLALSVGYTTVTSATATVPTCDATGFSSFTALTTTGSGLGAAISGAAPALQAGSANAVYYCFKISLPAAGSLPVGTDFQGRTVAPAWMFTAVSS